MPSTSSGTDVANDFYSASPVAEPVEATISPTAPPVAEPVEAIPAS